MVARAVNRASRRLGPQRRIQYALPTNGTLLTEWRIAFLERHRFKVQISFDGLAPAQDLRAPGSIGQLDRLISRLESGHRGYFHKRVTIAATVAAPTIPHAADSSDHPMAKGATRIAISPAIGQGWLSATQVAELDRRFGRIFKQSLQYYRATGDVPLAFFRKRAPDPRRPDESEWACAAPIGNNLFQCAFNRIALDYHRRFPRQS